MRSRARGLALHQNIVLDGYRHARQRSERLARFAIGVNRIGSHSRLAGVHFQERTNVHIVLVDAVKIAIERLPRREGSLFKMVSQLSDRHRSLLPKTSCTSKRPSFDVAGNALRTASISFPGGICTSSARRSITNS